MGIKYYHSAPQQIRRGDFIADAEGNCVYQFNNTTFIKNLPRVTVCTILDGDKLYVGYTVCSSKDQYRRKIGLAISKSRALKRPYTTVVIPDVKDVHEASLRIVNEIFERESKRLYGVSS